MSDSQPQRTDHATAETTCSAKPPASLRVVLLADDQALHCYGPVLRRLAVGLIDEVADLSLLSLGHSNLLRHLPSPPVRLITETRRHHRAAPPFDRTARQASVNAPHWQFIDKLWPQRRAKRLAQALSKFKPNLIHALSEKQADLARRLSKLLNIKYVLSLLEMEQNRLYVSHDRCGAVLCCNSSVARRIRQQRPRLASRVQLLPIGTHVSPEPCCFNHGSRLPNIICCSPFEYGFGLSSLINALKKLNDMGHQIHLVLSGCGSIEKDLRRQVVQLGLSGSVHFVPPIEMMVSFSDAYKAVFREADIFVQPWPARRWRPELLEAMSIGNAVVVADNSPNDLVIDDKTAVAVPFQNDRQLTDALDHMLKDRDYARTLSQNAQRHLRKHFLASLMVARLAKAYRNALSM